MAIEHLKQYLLTDKPEEHVNGLIQIHQFATLNAKPDLLDLFSDISKLSKAIKEKNLHYAFQRL
jgi:hypothetical protein